jgi:hypothetical protein
LVAEKLKGKEVRVTVNTDADIPTVLRAYNHKMLKGFTTARCLGFTTTRCLGLTATTL